MVVAGSIRRLRKAETTTDKEGGGGEISESCGLTGNMQKEGMKIEEFVSSFCVLPHRQSDERVRERKRRILHSFSIFNAL